jgi:hypothetical protein
VLGDLNLQFKPGLYSKKARWILIPIEQMKTFVSSLNSNKIKTGETGIYVKPVLFDSAGKIQVYWLILDVEAPDHSDLSANLEAAKEFLMWLDDNNLIDGLNIVLSGRGFRFIWPWAVPAEYHKAFMAWMHNTPCIDTAPHNNSFFRFFAYRGHPAQGKPAMDVHTHLLPDINDFWFMTSNEYHKLVKGPVSLETYIEWIHQGLLPRDYIPQPWVTLFEEYTRKFKLIDSIFTPNYRHLRNTDLGSIQRQVHAHLDELGIDRTEHQIYDTIYWKLDQCPICNRRDGHPWLTAYGRLKCYHANSCDAGQMDENGRIVGRWPSEWVPGFEGVDYEDTIAADDETEIPVSIDDARARMTEAINGNGDIIIPMTPGTGKTHTSLLNLVALCREKKIVYATPEKKLNEEIFTKAKEMGKKHGVNVYFIRGREEETNTRLATCFNMSKVQKATRLGFSPALIVCSRCIDRVRCPYYDQFKHFKKPGLFVMTYAQVKYFDLDKIGIDYFIVDENPIKSFIEKESATQGAVWKFQVGLGPEAKAVFQKMDVAMIEQLEVLQDNGGDHARIYVDEPPTGSPFEGTPTLWERGKITDEERQALTSDLLAYAQLYGETVYQWQHRLYSWNINLVALNWLWATLEHSNDRIAYIEISRRGKSDPFRFFYFRKNIPDYTGRIIQLDGTGRKSDIDRLFDRDFQVIEANVAIGNGRTVFFRQALGKTKTKKMSEGKIKKLLQKAISELRPTDRKVLLATHLIIEEKVAKIAHELMPDRKIETCHYFSNRGLNHWADFNAFIAFGTPTVNQAATLDEAMLLAGDEAERKEWWDWQGTSDLIQTVHRIRPINGGKTIIIMGREWPSQLGKPDVVVDLRRTDGKGQNYKGGESQKMLRAYDRLRGFVERHGFITKEIGWGLGVGLNRDREKLEIINDQIHAEIEKVGQKGVCCLIKYILDNTQPKTPLSPKSPIVLGDTHAWGKLLAKLKVNFPHLPDLKQSGKVNGYQKIKALGSLTAVRTFYARIGMPFSPESWHGREHNIVSQPKKIIKEFTPSVRGVCIGRLAAFRCAGQMECNSSPDILGKSNEVCVNLAA